MPGPRPKPTNLKRLQGNPGKRALNQNEPQPKIEIPPAPEHLTEAAQSEWNRIAEQLARLGLLTAFDRAALAAYCTVYGRWVEAEQALKQKGPVVKSPNGYAMISPYLIVANRALEQMRMFIIEFGLTPASRSRIAANPPEHEDPFESWMRDQA